MSSQVAIVFYTTKLSQRLVNAKFQYHAAHFTKFYLYSLLFYFKLLKTL